MKISTFLTWRPVFLFWWATCWIASVITLIFYRDSSKVVVDVFSWTLSVVVVWYQLMNWRISRIMRATVNAYSHQKGHETL